MIQKPGFLYTKLSLFIFLWSFYHYFADSDDWELSSVHPLQVLLSTVVEVSEFVLKSESDVTVDAQRVVTRGREKQEKKHHEHGEIAADYKKYCSHILAL